MLKNVEDNYAIYKRRRNAIPPMGDWNIQIQDAHTEHISNSDDIIALNVGGTRYEVLKKNFAYWPTTRLSQMVRATTKEDILKYCDGFSEFPSQEKPSEYYFRHNWSHFNSILDKLQYLETHSNIFKFLVKHKLNREIIDFHFRKVFVLL